MKGLFSTTGLLMVLVLVGCRTTASMVSSNFSYNGRFKEYKTFQFLDQSVTGLEPNYDRIVRKIIARRFIAQGYVYSEKGSDLLITYKRLDEAMEFVGFQQETLKQWMANPTGDYSRRIKKEKYKVKLPEDSLLVYLLDSGTGEIVWLGYSELIGSDLQERNLMVSVGRIMDNYRLTNY